MTVVSGDLKLVSDNPAAVTEVWIRAPRERLHGTGVILSDTDTIPVEAGVLTFTALPGPVRITPITNGGPMMGGTAGTTLEGVVPEGETATLKEVLEAAASYTPEQVTIFAQLRSQAEDAAVRAEAGAATVGDAQTVLTARDEAVTAAEEAAVSANATAAAMADKADLVDGRVPTSQIPAVALTKPQSVASRSSMLSLTDVQEGDVVIITTGDDKGSYMLGGGPASVPESWVALATSPDAPVQSVNGQSGTVVLGAGDVGAAPASHTHPATSISDATTVGRAVLTASDAAAARTVIGAGTSNLAIGTTSSTAKAGNYQPTAASITDATTVGRNVLKAADAAAARTAIGAGTSSLTLGTTSATAAAGDHDHSEYVAMADLESRTPEIRVVSTIPTSPTPGVVYLKFG